MRLIGVSVAVSAVLLSSSAVATAEPAQGQPDVGAYPTMPSAPLGLAGTMQAGARVEGQRLAGFVVGPWEVDPALVQGFFNGADVIDGPESLEAELPPELAAVGMRHNVIDGFSTGRRAEDKELRVTVLRFADTQTADGAAADFAQVANNGVASDGMVAPVQIPGHPDTAAFSHPFVDESHGPTTLVRSFTAHGPYVIIQRAGAVAGADGAATLIAGALERQGPLLDEFPALAPDQLAGQPLDPTGLLARSLPVDPEEATVSLPGVYDARAALHFEHDPITSIPLFADTGLTNRVNGSVGVWEVRDSQGAQRIVDELMTVPADYATPADPIAG
ncbi:MAG: hypothetical protein K0R68_3821, partial [Mycobacterium sp.]|nr:hypothetical protein [Mycobacterium sp.]